MLTIWQVGSVSAQSDRPLVLGQWIDSYADQRSTYYFLEDGSFYFEPIAFGNWENGIYGYSGEWRLNGISLEVKETKKYLWKVTPSRDADNQYSSNDSTILFQVVSSPWINLGDIGSYANELKNFLANSQPEKIGSRPVIYLRKLDEHGSDLSADFQHAGPLAPSEPVAADDVEYFLGAKEVPKPGLKEGAEFR